MINNDQKEFIRTISKINRINIIFKFQSSSYFKRKLFLFIKNNMP